MVRLTPTRLLCAAVAVSVFLLFSLVSKLFFGARGYDLEALQERPPPAHARPATPDPPFGEECSPFKGGAMEDVSIVLRMGAAEAANKLPGYLNRLGRCKQDLLLFSDRSADINGFDVVDALANLRPEYRYNNPDFDVYDRIQLANTTEEKAIDGWRLDKYKFLPMMELTAHMRPESQWFVFLELETYVNWDNLYRFLSKFDPETPHYFGAPVWPPKKTVFGQSASGFVLSRGALDKLMARGRMFAENQQSPGTHMFGKDVSQGCCGDEVLAQVLKESGVPIRGYWPMFNGERPTSTHYGYEQWCEAVITLQQEEDLIGFQRWEEARPHPARPLTFEELFTFMEHALQDRRDDWSNLSNDIVFHKGQRAAKSYENCLNACTNDKKCIQFEHTSDSCKLSHSIRLGYHLGPNGDYRWTSGWLMDRVRAFKATHSPCQGAHFVHANP
ncbi:hypothetical protein BS50DRAFT_296881 [Corynespora cassiicola Philippines]|uniref:N-acetylgalactosaminide beta-1,3-galactosyltransferase n=1 Tax=Corynespora cassiicola Philippines TaxID=1448308 RepID=A0A2T2NWM8_CORCC|nr:hypothetical protein BS50DRAFT_296881 [Corynespora cassiicola Philippines]